MLFFGDFSNQYLSERLAQKFQTEIFYPEVTVFPDGERRVRILQDVSNQDIFILKSFGQPVDPGIPEFCFTVDCLKQNGANLVNAIVPYLPYSRADHMFRTGEGVPLETVIRMFESSRLNRILIVDPHTIKTPEVFKIPVINTSALALFAAEIEKIEPDFSKVCLVSPDMGGIRRIKLISQMLDNVPYVTITKERDLETGKLGISGVNGEIKEICMVVDDMVSSGKTAAQAADKLMALGAKKVYGFATHAVFTKEAPQILQNSAYEKIYVTDSLPVTFDKQFEKLKILSLADLISTSLQ